MFDRRSALFVAWSLTVAVSCTFERGDVKEVEEFVLVRDVTSVLDYMGTEGYRAENKSLKVLRDLKLLVRRGGATDVDFERAAAAVDRVREFRAAMTTLVRAHNLTVKSIESSGGEVCDGAPRRIWLESVGWGRTYWYGASQ